jgi:hypothetical protein
VGRGEQLLDDSTDRGVGVGGVGLQEGGGLRRVGGRPITSKYRRRSKVPGSAGGENARARDFRSLATSKSMLASASRLGVL